MSAFSSATRLLTIAAGYRFHSRSAKKKEGTFDLSGTLPGALAHSIILQETESQH